MEALETAIQHLIAPSLLAIGRPLVIAEPCVGAGGVRSLWRIAKAVYESVNTFDRDARLRGFYNKMDEHFGAEGRHGGGAKEAFGEEGDVLNVDPDRLHDADLIIMGPPCTAWAGRGHKKGAADPASFVFDMLLEWVIILAHRGALLMFLIENSPNCFDYAFGAEEEYMVAAVRKLRAEIPYFHVDVVCSDLGRFLPHKRTRAFLRGQRADTLVLYDSIPLPLTRLTERPVQLGELLDDGEAMNVCVSELTTKRQENIAYYLKAIEEDSAAGKAGRIAVCDVDRGPGRAHKPVLAYDVIPALQTKGPEFLLISTDDPGVDPAAKQTFRFLTEPERFRLLGHPGCYSGFAKKTFARHLTGNAYAVPMLAAVLAPMLLELGRSKAVKPTGIHTKSIKDIFRLTALAQRQRRRAQDEDEDHGPRVLKKLKTD